ncbi:MAG: hypothetical protein HOP36_13465 [Methyloglobulus sp.]|nr:hypothetical protein [Methyloglobulus sp.]
MRKMILFFSALLLAATASFAFAANCDAMNGAWKASKLPRYNAPDVIDVAKGLYSPANDRGGANVSPFSYKCIGENLFQFDGSMTRQYTLSADGMRAKSVFKNPNSGFTMVEDDMVKITADYSYKEPPKTKKKFAIYSKQGCYFKLLESNSDTLDNITLEDAKCVNDSINGTVTVKMNSTVGGSLEWIKFNGFMINGVFDGPATRQFKFVGSSGDSPKPIEFKGGCVYIEECDPIDLSQYKIDDPLAFGVSASPRVVKAKAKKKK